MKNAKLFLASLMLLAGAFFTLSGFTAPPNGNEEAQLIGRARGAAANCIAPHHAGGYEIDGQVETVGICFVSGELKRVSFYRTVRCNEQQNNPCPRPFVLLIATVDFGCDNEVVSVQCYN